MSNDTKVISLLEKYGPMLSGELAQKFEDEYGVSNDTARQAISRAKKSVKKLYGLSFEKNQKFVYLTEQYLSFEYYKNLLEAVQKYSKTNWIYICAFLSQSGYVSKSILPSMVSSPIKNVKGHKLYKNVIENMLKCNIIEEYDETRWALGYFPSLPNNNLSRSIGIEIAKKQIVNDFTKLIKNINLVAYESVKSFTDFAEFAKFQWAFTAPSYIQPLYNMESEKNGFVIGDVFYGKVAKEEDVMFFINKLNIIRKFKGLPAFLPILIVENVTPGAHKLLKDNKVVVAFIKEIFSQRYAELLSEIVKIFTNASAIISKNPAQLEKLFSEISKSEGKYNDIIGDMFELMVGYYYQKIGSEYLEIGKHIHVPGSDLKNEIDVLVKRDGKIIIVECKATRSPIDETFADKWLTKNIPRIRSWLIEEYSDIKNFEFQLWSLGGFTEGANKLLEDAANNTKKYKIEYFNYSQIIEIVKNKNVNLLVKILCDHFDSYVKANDKIGNLIK